MKVFWIFLLPTILLASPLQDAINTAKPYSVLSLKPGIYKGNIEITKPLSLLCKSGVCELRGEGKNTVVDIKSSEVSLKGFLITNSGHAHEGVNAGINAVNVKYLEIINNEIKNCLFGINLENVDMSVIKQNKISSIKGYALGLRGDALRLWYSNFNKILNNRFINSRDMVVWYSHGNKIYENYAKGGRYALHFMYAGANEVVGNVYEDNSAGIFFMYAKDSLVANNKVFNSIGINGIGIGFKESSNMIIRDNTVLYNSLGLYIDRSPYEVDATNLFLRNHIFYNDVGVQFHSLSEGNLFLKNSFKGNLTTLINDSINGRNTNKALSVNTWRGNYFDDYEGFDVDKNGVGDIPYTALLFLDQNLGLYPNTAFFYGSPALKILNFLNKLAPISKPVFLMSDKYPALKIIPLHRYKMDSFKPHKLKAKELLRKNYE